MKMTTLSRRHWRDLIRTHLERWDPIHSRWLQEHPRQSEMLNDVVTDAIDVWCQAMAARQDPNWPPDPWTRLDLDELEELIVARTVETTELWEDLAETYPRTTPPSRPEPIGPMPLQVIPPTGPKRPRSPRRR